MTVNQLLQDLNDHDPKERIRIDMRTGNLLIGRNYSLSMPTIHNPKPQEAHNGQSES